MAKKYIKPVPKTQREISTALQTPFDVRVGNPNDAKENSQFPPENQANIPFNRSTKMSFKGDTTKPYTVGIKDIDESIVYYFCLLYTSPSPRDRQKSRMPSSA